MYRCPWRNVPEFDRLNYIDITKNTYIRSSLVMDIMPREKCGLLAVPLSLI
jgi:hypothetical protein